MDDDAARRTGSPSPDRNAPGDPRSGQALSKASAEELTQALDCVRQPTMLIDCFGGVRLANRALEELLGVREPDLRSRPVGEWLAPATDEPAAATLLQAARMKPGEPLEVVLAEANGRRHAASVRCTPLRAADGDQLFVCCVFELSHAEIGSVLEMLGGVAANVTHDLNNHLAAVLNYSFILERKLSEGPLAVHVGELRAAAWRASRLASSVQRFANPPQQPAWRDAIPVVDIVMRTAPAMRHVLGSARLDVDVASDLGSTSAPPAHLEEILVGLAVHAANTRSPGAAVRLTGARTERGPRLVLELPAPSGHAGRPVQAWTFRRALKRSRVRLTRRRGAIVLDLPPA